MRKEGYNLSVTSKNIYILFSSTNVFVGTSPYCCNENDAQAIVESVRANSCVFSPLPLNKNHQWNHTSIIDTIVI